MHHALRYVKVITTIAHLTRT